MPTLLRRSVSSNWSLGSGRNGRWIPRIWVYIAAEDSYRSHPEFNTPPSKLGPQSQLNCLRNLSAPVPRCILPVGSQTRLAFQQVATVEKKVGDCSLSGVRSSRGKKKRGRRRPILLLGAGGLSSAKQIGTLNPNPNLHHHLSPKLYPPSLQRHPLLESRKTSRSTNRQSRITGTSDELCLTVYRVSSSGSMCFLC